MSDEYNWMCGYYASWYAQSTTSRVDYSPSLSGHLTLIEFFRQQRRYVDDGDAAKILRLALSTSRYHKVEREDHLCSLPVVWLSRLRRNLQNRQKHMFGSAESMQVGQI